MDIKKAGTILFTIGTDLSDFLVWRKRWSCSRRLGNRGDDFYMKITEVVRVEDLLFQTRQTMSFI